MEQRLTSGGGNKGVWILWMHGQRRRRWKRWRSSSTSQRLGLGWDTKVRGLILVTNDIYVRSLVAPFLMLRDVTPPPDYEYTMGTWSPVR